MTTLKITGMTCQNCVRHVTQALEAVPGVSSAKVNLEAGTAEIEGGEPQALVAAVEEEGYQVQPV